MPKKPTKIAPRLPPSAADRFVESGQPADVRASRRPSAQTSDRSGTPRGPGIVSRRTGDRRRMTVYLPPELAERLERRAFEERRELSEIIAAALARHLGEG